MSNIGMLFLPVSISYPFDNPMGWVDFAAYHIAEDGTKTAEDWIYDEENSLAIIHSTHHSIYAVLEVTEESGKGSMAIWIALGVVAAIVILAIVFFAVRSRKA